MFFEPDYYLKACRDGARFKTWNGTIRVRYEKVGELNLPSGNVIACDPMFFGSPYQAFTFSVPPGKYPLHIAFFGMPQGCECVAFANLTFTNEAPARWEMAVLPGQNLDDLPPDTFFGYPVDSGTAGFISPEASTALTHLRLDDIHEAFEFLAPPARFEHQWAEIMIDPQAELNAFVFDSGGDGRYASYVNFDAHDRVASFFTEFGLLREIDGLVDVD